MSAVAVHDVVTGPADAPVVVLSNSLGSTTSMWDAQADTTRQSAASRTTDPVPLTGLLLASPRRW